MLGNMQLCIWGGLQLRMFPLLPTFIRIDRPMRPYNCDGDKERDILETKHIFTISSSNRKQIQLSVQKVRAFFYYQKTKRIYIFRTVNDNILRPHNFSSESFRPYPQFHLCSKRCSNIDLDPIFMTNASVKVHLQSHFTCAFSTWRYIFENNFLVS